MPIAGASPGFGRDSSRLKPPNPFLGGAQKPNPPTPSWRPFLTPGANAVPSPAERARVIRYSGDIEGKGDNRGGPSVPPQPASIFRPDWRFYQFARA